MTGNDYLLQLFSEHMKTAVSSRTYQAIYLNQTDPRGEYQCQLKKELFIKFFSLLKLGGSGNIGLTSGQLMDFEFNTEKSSFFTINLEVGCR